MFDSKNFVSTHGSITAKEIIQQPRMWLESVKILESRLPEIQQFMQHCNHPGLRVCITGAGSSGYCGEMVSAAANRYLGYRSDAPHTTDIVGAPGTVLFDNIPTLLISLGRSGNSPESVGAVEYARKTVKHLFEICITCAEDGALHQVSKGRDNALSVVLPKETCDQGFAMTSSTTSMALAAYGVLSYHQFDLFKEGVSGLAAAVSRSLHELCGAAQQAVAEMPFDRAIFLGAGVLKGAAHESAIKMSELTKGGVNVTFDTPLGFRHGPKSVITDGAFTVHMMSSDQHTKQYDMDLLNEIITQKQGNRVITVSDRKLNVTGVDYEVLFDSNFKNDFFLSVAMVVFSQLFAFFKSQAMGIPTDNPCPKGELNRVVKGVTIYPLRGSKL